MIVSRVRAGIIRGRLGGTPFSISFAPGTRIACGNKVILKVAKRFKGKGDEFSYPMIGFCYKDDAPVTVYIQFASFHMLPWQQYVSSPYSICVLVMLLLFSFSQRESIK